MDIGTNINLNKIGLKKIGFFRFKKLGNKVLLTNDIGGYIFLTPNLFRDFLEEKIPRKDKIYGELKEKGFIEEDLDYTVDKWRKRNSFIFQGPSLHIIVVTKRCNYNCIYCQVSSVGMKEEGYDMDIPTAKKVIDTAFCTPSKTISIEFQGGEPLVNWPVIKFCIKYAKEKKQKTKKNLRISLVSNFSLMTEEKCNYLLENQVSLCTSLDGPEKLHNKNRPWLNHNSYKAATDWIKKISKLQKTNPTIYKVSALATISRNSLKYPKEIVDEYLKWDFPGIHLRPLSYLGLSRKTKEIGYSSKEFIKFWKKAMDYIIELNLKGEDIFERGAVLMLQKILTDADPGYLDLRSPCGAGIGQLLYNYNGKVYTCDEGRMVDEETFMIGDVKKNSYKEIVSHKTVKSLCVASLLEDLPCDDCAYKPYCGVCPVQNYAIYGDIFSSSPDNERCLLNKWMLDYLFEKLQNKKIKEIFKKWIEKVNKGRIDFNDN